jgi:hypothetical protein
MQVPINLPEKKFTNAEPCTSGKLVGQRKIVLGWGKRRATEYEVL